MSADGSCCLLDPTALPVFISVLRLSGCFLPTEGIEGQQGHSAAVWKVVPDFAAFRFLLLCLRLYLALRLSGWILPTEGIEGQQGHFAAVWKAVPCLQTDPAACSEPLFLFVFLHVGRFFCLVCIPSPRFPKSKSKNIFDGGGYLGFAL